MSEAQTTDVFNCTPEQMFEVITDYDRYPDFLQEVKSCKVVREESGRKLVEFGVKVIKSFSYSLWMTETKPNSLTWEFGGGDLFKFLHGSWTLEDEAGKVRATYKVEAKFKVFVPGPVSRALVGVNLPGMMSAYHKRVEELYGR